MSEGTASMSIAKHYERLVKEETIRLDAGKVGMVAFLCSEVAFFSSLFVAYVVYIGGNLSRPTAGEALALWPSIVNTVLMVLSSFTVFRAARNASADRPIASFVWLLLTVAFGTAFLVVTGIEWYGLIVHQHVMIYTNLFGTTYYTLVGFDCAHVAVGLALLLILAGMAMRGWLVPHKNAAVLVSWYWHFVVLVWIAVFVVVYLFSR
jgi:cytochrome c oxidase subunit 3